jgi:DNA-directed RNA polymerase beta' subunit
MGMSNGALTEPLMLSAKNTEPEEGGLFDPSITGGIKGNKWSHYKLAEPIVNPVFENPVRSILGLSSNDFEKITSGAYGIQKNEKGNFNIVDTASGKLVKEHKI